MCTMSGTTHSVADSYQLGWLADAAAATDSLFFFASIGVGTHNDPLNPSRADSELGQESSPALFVSQSSSESAAPSQSAPPPTRSISASVGTETDELDLDQLELQLKILQNATDLPKKKGKKTLSTGVSKATATDEVRLKAFGTNTPKLRLVESGANTDVADVHSTSDGNKQTRDKGVATIGNTTRSVYSGTEPKDCRDKAVGGQLVRTRDSGTLPAFPTALLPASNNAFSAPPPSRKLVPQRSEEIQVDLPPSEEEILEWVVEYQQQVWDCLHFSVNGMLSATTFPDGRRAAAQRRRSQAN